MNILPCSVPALETNSKEDSAKTPVNRRIEVTVERETINMLVRESSKKTRKGRLRK